MQHLLVYSCTDNTITKVITLEDQNLQTIKSADEELLTPEFLRKLEGLSLVARRLFPGRMRGERRSIRRGASVEFADYRNYSTGDDFRRVDWNVYARLEKLFLKLFVEEEDLRVYILIDTSQSMSFGSPSKLLYAKRIAAALSYIALCGFDQVSVCALSECRSSVMKPKRGKQSAIDIFDYLNNISSAGKTSLSASIRDFCLRNSHPGLAVVLSDFLDPEYASCISPLVSRKFDVLMLQVLDQQEATPTLVGDLMLLDCENGDKKEVTITQSLLRGYHERLSELINGLERVSATYGCGYIQVTNQTPFEDLVLGYMRQRGALK